MKVLVLDYGHVKFTQTTYLKQGRPKVMFALHRPNTLLCQEYSTLSSPLRNDYDVVILLLLMGNNKQLLPFGNFGVNENLPVRN